MTPINFSRPAPARPAHFALEPQSRLRSPSKGRVPRLIPVILALWAAGCGGGEPTLKDPAVTGPHGLPAVPIPGGLGYAEARLESPSEAKPAGHSGAKTASRTHAVSHKGAPAQVAVYFLEPDAKTPLAPLPEKVQALLGMPGTLANHYIQPYDLKNEPRSDDPAAAARFASPPFPLPEQHLSGRVKAVVQGQEVQFPLVVTDLK